MDNREIDKLVAERVMGWRLETALSTQSKWWFIDRAGQICSCPYFSTDIADAWRVVEKIRTLVELCQGIFCDDIALAAYDDDWAVATIRAGRGHYPHAMLRIIMPTPAAICRAALKAVGVEVTDAHT